MEQLAWPAACQRCGAARASRWIQGGSPVVSKRAAGMQRPRRSSSAGAAGRRRKSRASLAWVGAAGALVLVGLVALAWSGAFRQSGPSQSASGQSATAPAIAAQAAGPSAAQGSAAPDFNARLLGGGSFTLSQQQGKPVLVLFSASWCEPCIPEVNKMAQLQDQFGSQGLQQLVLSVDPGDTEAEFAGLRQQTRGQNLLWGLDPGQKATLAYKIRATDTKVLVDGREQIVFQTVGPTPLETLSDKVAGALR